MREAYDQIDAISSSKLNAFERQLSGLPKLESNRPALMLGSEVHRQLLEPHKPADPNYQAVRDANLIVQSAYKISSLNAVLADENTHTEVIACEDLEVFGKQVSFKGIFDIINKDINLLADIKTTSTINQISFLGSMSKFNYWSQAAIYTRLAGIDNMVFFGLQTKKPYNTYIVETINYPALMEAGWQRVKYLTELYLNQSK